MVHQVRLPLGFDAQIHVGHGHLARVRPVANLSVERHVAIAVAVEVHLRQGSADVEPQGLAECPFGLHVEGHESQFLLVEQLAELEARALDRSLQRSPRFAVSLDVGVA